MSPNARASAMSWHLSTSSVAKRASKHANLQTTLERSPYCVVGLNPAPSWSSEEAWAGYEVVTIVAYRLRGRNLSRPFLRAVLRPPSLARRRRGSRSDAPAHATFDAIANELADFLSG